MEKVYLIDAGTGVPIAERLETLREKVGNKWTLEQFERIYSLDDAHGCENDETFIKPFT